MDGQTESLGLCCRAIAPLNRCGNAKTNDVTAASQRNFAFKRRIGTRLQRNTGGSEALSVPSLDEFSLAYE